jgi:rSAM/selenodomain-associated transferase 2
VSASISVVIPCLNEAAIVVGRLSALQPLREAGHELILADGGSIDGTLECASVLADRVESGRPGRAVQMNNGARAASGAVLWFLHLDSRPPPDAALAVLECALDGPGWGRFDVRLDGAAPMLRVIERMMNLRSRLSGIVTGDQGMFVRRDLFQRVGGFPEIALMEDLAISRRLKRLARPARIPEPVLASSRRWDRDGIWRTIALMWFLRGAYWLGADPDWLARIYYPSAVPGSDSQWFPEKGL